VCRQQEADLHNLFVEDTRVNARRGSLPFGEALKSEYPDAAPSEIGRDAQGREVMEVRAARRGDVARALTYMAARWGLRFPTPHARTLLAWSAADPPDARERARNDEIERLQGNRNLLVDCPALVEGVLRVAGE